jgi:hypothetical protein
MQPQVGLIINVLLNIKSVRADITFKSSNSIS